MNQAQPIESATLQNAAGQRLLVIAGWALVVFLFASQWYAYDATRGGANPFAYYLGWSCYMWALAPLVLWFARRYPIRSESWKSMVPLHVAASVALTIIQVSVEASLGWLRLEHGLSFKAAIRHYFSQHTQLSLLTYWMLVAVAQFYRMYEQARARQLQAAQLETRLAEAQLDLLRTQLQPHFLFNTLQAATMLIHEDPQGAEDILLRLGQLLRISLDELHVQEIPLAREIEFLEHYIGIQQRRFGDRLRFELRVDDDILDSAVPTFVLQPLVENAVRHGIGKHREGDVVSIRAFQQQNHVVLEVSNRSSSLDDTLARLMARGVGLANTQARLRQLYGREQALQLRDLEPRGVCVRLSLPLRRLSVAQTSISAEVAR